MSSLELKILNILENKLLSIGSSSSGDLYYEYGREKLLEKLKNFIQENQSIDLLLPGFPCKSQNNEKVSGKFPDAGEIYALEYLNNICREISLLYQYGCKLTIWSDGRVFEDLIGISYCDILTYRDYLKDYSLTMKHIQWINMNNHLRIPTGENLIKNYLTSTFSYEKWLIKSENNQKQINNLKIFMKNDLINNIKYKFLPNEQLENEINIIVKQLIIRNDALTNLLKQHYPNHIRLSIHQHINNGEKYSSEFFINNIKKFHHERLFRTPWHNVLVINLNGNFNLIPYQQINLNNEYIPIIFNKQLWCFVQLSKDLFNFNLKLSIYGKSPRFGLLIDLNKNINSFQLNIDWLKMLLEKFGMIILRNGQNSLKKTNYLQFCKQFGSVCSLKDILTSENNHISQESIPLHFDLCDTSEHLSKIDEYNNNVPQYLMFYCVNAPLKREDGKINFINGRLFLESIDEKEILQWKTINFSNIIKQSYTDEKSFTYPMIMSHPKTDENIFRYMEPSDNVICSINGNEIDRIAFKEFDNKMKKMMYDSHWYIEHTWDNDDLIIVENHLLLHSQTAISEKSECELWKVQVY